MTYGGVSWREHDNLGEMAAVLSVMRQLHEMLRHLVEAEDRVAGVTGDLRDRIGALVAADPDRAARPRRRRRCAPRSATCWRGPAPACGRGGRSGSTSPTTTWPAGTCAGPTCGARPCAGRCSSGPTCAAPTSPEADLLGADVRDTDVRGAMLAGALFLTQPQVNGDAGRPGTRLPGGLARPGHWLGE